MTVSPQTDVVPRPAGYALNALSTGLAVPSLCAADHAALTALGFG